MENAVADGVRGDDAERDGELEDDAEEAATINGRLFQ